MFDILRKGIFKDEITQIEKILLKMEDNTYEYVDVFLEKYECQQKLLLKLTKAITEYLSNLKPQLSKQENIYVKHIKSSIEAKTELEIFNCYKEISISKEKKINSLLKLVRESAQDYTINEENDILYHSEISAKKNASPMEFGDASFDLEKQRLHFANSNLHSIESERNESSLSLDSGESEKKSEEDNGNGEQNYIPEQYERLDSPVKEKIINTCCKGKAEPPNYERIKPKAKKGNQMQKIKISKLGTAETQTEDVMNKSSQKENNDILRKHKTSVKFPTNLDALNSCTMENHEINELTATNKMNDGPITKCARETINIKNLKTSNLERNQNSPKNKRTVSYERLANSFSFNALNDYNLKKGGEKLRKKAIKRALKDRGSQDKAYGGVVQSNSGQPKVGFHVNNSSSGHNDNEGNHSLILSSKTKSPQLFNNEKKDESYSGFSNTNSYAIEETSRALMGTSKTRKPENKSKYLIKNGWFEDSLNSEIWSDANPLDWRKTDILEESTSIVYK